MEDFDYLDRRSSGANCCELIVQARQQHADRFGEPNPQQLPAAAERLRKRQENERNQTDAEQISTTLER